MPGPIRPLGRMDDLERALAERVEPERIAGMAAYMRNQFPFMGVRSSGIIEATREAFGSWQPESGDEVMEVVAACWDRGPREFQHAGIRILRRHVRLLEGGQLPALETCIVTKPWWDTVDMLATNVVGPIVRAEPGLRSEMDRWLRSGNLWLERSAILHQLTYREDLDQEWLFDACLRHASSTEFFHRKAIGWALRQHARSAPEAVRQFVAEHDHELSGLSKREALKHLR